jgi:hypothetical protein
MTASISAQRGLVWWAVAFMVIYGFAWIFLLRMMPPPAASLSAAEVAKFYSDNADGVRLGAALAAWTSGFMVPFATVISVQLLRLEKGMGGIMMSIFLVLPPDFWGTAGFHPGRLIDATAMMNDLANLTLVTTDQYYMFQLVPIAVIALTTPPRADSPFPRWFGYYTIWTMIVFEVGPLGFLFKSGPFAWNGLIVFWLPLSFFGAWLGVTAWRLLHALRLQEAQPATT